MSDPIKNAYIFRKSDGSVYAGPITESEAVVLMMGLSEEAYEPRIMD